MLTDPNHSFPYNVCHRWMAIVGLACVFVAFIGAWDGWGGFGGDWLGEGR